MNEKKRHPFLRCLGIIGAFWALFLFGPILLMLVNAFSAWFSGGGYFEGSFGYEVLRFLSQPIACLLACGAAKSISDKEHNVCVIVNAVVAVCLSLLMAAFEIIAAGQILRGIAHVLSAATLIYCAVTASWEIKKNTE